MKTSSMLRILIRSKCLEVSPTGRIRRDAMPMTRGIEEEYACVRIRYEGEYRHFHKDHLTDALAIWHTLDLEELPRALLQYSPGANPINPKAYILALAINACLNQ